MNKHNAKDYLPLVQALADGKVIQVKDANGWEDVTAELALCFAPDQYRIKPEPKEIWVNEYPFDDDVIHMSEQRAKEGLRRDGVTRRYREVIE